MIWEQFEGRKRDHIRHALDPAHQAAGLTGLERIHLIHEALPELDFGKIRLQTDCLGRPLATPFFVSGMTAGHADASRINRTLSQACAERGWAMGVGSQRRDLDGADAGAPGVSELRSDALLNEWVGLREQAPGLVLLANLGLSQLIGASASRIRERVLQPIGAQALAVHANALQEALQPEGTPQFKGGLEALGALARELGTPVVLKETGSGFSRRTLERVAKLALAAVDVSGLGGTHWGRIEGARALGGSLKSASERSSDTPKSASERSSDTPKSASERSSGTPKSASERSSGTPLQAAAAETFANWGEPTAECVLSAREAFAAAGAKTEIWASGGVRTGLDAAKLIALGAHRVGYAQPALKAALEGPEALRQWMQLQEYELKVALFCTGCASPGELRVKEGAWKKVSA